MKKLLSTAIISLFNINAYALDMTCRSVYHDVITANVAKQGEDYIVTDASLRELNGSGTLDFTQAANLSDTFYYNNDSLYIYYTMTFEPDLGTAWIEVKEKSDGSLLATYEFSCNSPYFN